VLASLPEERLAGDEQLTVPSPRFTQRDAAEGEGRVAENAEHRPQLACGLGMGTGIRQHPGQHAVGLSHQVIRPFEALPAGGLAAGELLLEAARSNEHRRQVGAGALCPDGDRLALRRPASAGSLGLVGHGLTGTLGHPSVLRVCNSFTFCSAECCRSVTYSRQACYVPVSRAQLTVADILNEAPRSRFHRRAIVVSGMGFFTDAYDLFVISTVSTLVAAQWHLSTVDKSWVSGAAILGAFIGALVFGRVADLLGRKSVYVMVAAIMIVGALLSAFSVNLWWLVASRLLLGLGIGGDYPVSAVLMSEYSNRRDRGRMVGLVFSMQAVGLIVGPLVALTLLSSGVSHLLTWRLLLGLGAVPAAAVIWLRSKMPESPRFQADVRGDYEKAAADLHVFSDTAALPASGGELNGSARASSGPSEPARPRTLRLGDFLRDARMLRLLLGTAGGWLFFDYAYYGNTLSLPMILKEVSPAASLDVQLLWTLAIFVACAVPGYVMAFTFMDRIGHRKLQLIGFGVMAAAFLTLGAFEPLTTIVAPFLAIFGLSYFFVQFGPNMTTFVLPSEVFPVRARTTGHGVAAGIGKLGAFIGVFLVPALQKSIGLRLMLIVSAAAAICGAGLTLLLPEPSQRTLEELSEDTRVVVTPARIGASSNGLVRGSHREGGSLDVLTPVPDLRDGVVPDVASPALPVPRTTGTPIECAASFEESTSARATGTA
jgi:PHS family inorganic phosphate transporter-like MFS transporter